MPISALLLVVQFRLANLFANVLGRGCGPLGEVIRCRALGRCRGRHCSAERGNGVKPPKSANNKRWLKYPRIGYPPVDTREDIDWHVRHRRVARRNRAGE